MFGWINRFISRQPRQSKEEKGDLKVQPSPWPANNCSPRHHAEHHFVEDPRPAHIAAQNQKQGFYAPGPPYVSVLARSGASVLLAPQQLEEASVQLVNELWQPYRRNTDIEARDDVIAALLRLQVHASNADTAISSDPRLELRFQSAARHPWSLRLALAMHEAGGAAALTRALIVALKQQQQLDGIDPAEVAARFLDITKCLGVVLEELQQGDAPGPDREALGASPTVNGNRRNQPLSAACTHAAKYGAVGALTSMLRSRRSSIAAAAVSPLLHLAVAGPPSKCSPQVLAAAILGPADRWVRPAAALASVNAAIRAASTLDSFLQRRLTCASGATPLPASLVRATLNLTCRLAYGFGCAWPHLGQGGGDHVGLFVRRSAPTALLVARCAVTGVMPPSATLGDMEDSGFPERLAVVVEALQALPRGQHSASALYEAALLGSGVARATASGGNRRMPLTEGRADKGAASDDGGEDAEDWRDVDADAAARAAGSAAECGPNAAWLALPAGWVQDDATILADKALMGPTAPTLRGLAACLTQMSLGPGDVNLYGGELNRALVGLMPTVADALEHQANDCHTLSLLELSRHLLTASAAHPSHGAASDGGPGVDVAAAAGHDDGGNADGPDGGAIDSAPDGTFQAWLGQRAQHVDVAVGLATTTLRVAVDAVGASGLFGHGFSAAAAGGGGGTPGRGGCGSGRGEPPGFVVPFHIVGGTSALAGHTGAAMGCRSEQAALLLVSSLEAVLDSLGDVLACPRSHSTDAQRLPQQQVPEHRLQALVAALLGALRHLNELLLEGFWRRDTVIGVPLCVSELRRTVGAAAVSAEGGAGVGGPGMGVHTTAGVSLLERAWRVGARVSDVAEAHMLQACAAPFSPRPSPRTGANPGKRDLDADFPSGLQPASKRRAMDRTLIVLHDGNDAGSGGAVTLALASRACKGNEPWDDGPADGQEETAGGGGGYEDGGCDGMEVMAAEMAAAAAADLEQEKLSPAQLQAELKERVQEWMKLCRPGH